MSQRIVVFCLGKSALALAQKIAKHLNAELHGKAERFNSETGQKQDDDAVSKFPVPKIDVFFTDAMQHLAALFSEGTAIIGVCASGILIRGVAGCLENKHNEPPLIAVAEDGSSVIPFARWTSRSKYAGSKNRKINRSLAGCNHSWRFAFWHCIGRTTERFCAGQS